MKKLILVLLLLPFGLFAQEIKKKIDHTVYNSWNSIKNVSISNDGEISTFQIKPHQGDPLFYIKNSTDNTILDTIWRAGNANIHHNSEFVCYTVTASFDSIRQLKLDKVKKDKYPKDTLGIYWTKGDSTELIPNIKSYKLSKDGDWMAYLLADDTRPDCEVYKCKFKQKRNKCTKDKTSGTTLVLYNPITKNRTEIFQVTDYHFNEQGTRLAFVTSLKGKTDSLSLFVSELNPQAYTAFGGKIKVGPVMQNSLSIKSIVFDKNGEQIAFLMSNDTNKRKTYELAYWSKSLDSAKIIVDSLTTNMIENWTVSEHKAPYFSRDGKKLFFGTNQIVEQDVEDTLLVTEKAKVDVWSWTDKKLQPMQLKQKRMEEKRTFLAVYNTQTLTFTQLANENLPSVRLYDHDNADLALGIYNEKYQLEQSWAFPWKSDYYSVNVNSGEQKLIKEEILYGGRLTPSGDYFIWYDGLDSNWFAKNLKTNSEYNLTKSIDANLASDNNGNPFVAYPEGIVGWTKDNNQEKMILNSEFDIWLIDLSNKTEPKSITNEKGEEDKIRYRLNTLERDSTYLVLNNNLIHGFNTKTKDEFYIKPSNIEKRYLETDHTFAYLSKAKKSDKVFFRMMNFVDYPELYVTDMNFAKPKQLSKTNPQQDAYNWGTVELIHWTSYKGLELDGLLYKPEDFDSTKSYPMIVYFYEKYGDDMHRHYIPKPTASIVYATEYVSAGYIVFIPDVKYTPGHPAKSAYDCILSGTDYLTQKYNWIDTTKMGLQGQSWGGYQTAQLITMTDKYACGMAGAPVSNMFSAYGGVRWGSGMSRAFQYERTQSRIGCTIWECPELYIENSPIFGLPNVHTPLLIMHNDGDGAVPWYQGIEMYMGMRRLNKPVWMLNYNGDGHNLMKNANREDLSIRMRQFFDYYLLEEPMPLWMKDGVKAIDKGKNTDLELSE
jgi:dipeptidyl aminopeptidase/acylaminoacyl peptidase